MFKLINGLLIVTFFITIQFDSFAMEQIKSDLDNIKKGELVSTQIMKENADKITKMLSTGSVEEKKQLQILIENDPESINKIFKVATNSVVTNILQDPKSKSVLATLASKALVGAVSSGVLVALQVASGNLGLDQLVFPMVLGAISSFAKSGAKMSISGGVDVDKIGLYQSSISDVSIDYVINNISSAQKFLNIIQSNKTIAFIGGLSISKAVALKALTDVIAQRGGYVKLAQEVMDAFDITIVPDLSVPDLSVPDLSKGVVTANQPIQNFIEQKMEIAIKKPEIRKVLANVLVASVVGGITGLVLYQANLGYSKEISMNNAMFGGAFRGAINGLLLYASTAITGQVSKNLLVTAGFGLQASRLASLVGTGLKTADNIIPAIIEGMTQLAFNAVTSKATPKNAKNFASAILNDYVAPTAQNTLVPAKWGAASLWGSVKSGYDWLVFGSSDFDLSNFSV